MYTMLEPRFRAASTGSSGLVGPKISCQESDFPGWSLFTQSCANTITNDLSRIYLFHGLRLTPIDITYQRLLSLLATFYRIFFVQHGGLGIRCGESKFIILLW